MNARYGATPQEWDQWIALGLTSELLPLVSNPHAKISGFSTMEKVGKTPSVYNYQGCAVGIPKWTGITATDQMIQDWKKIPDYGICLQTTRRVKAFDIDIKDPVMAQKVVDTIDQVLGISLPIRRRADSGKCLLLFLSDETDLMKHTIHTDHGVIELLARGNQCVVAGQHEDGARYEWTDLEGLVPLVKDDRVKVWTTLALMYSNGRETGHERHAPTGMVSSVAAHDPVVDYLIEHKLTKGQDAGKVFVTCPWRERHGKKGDMTQTVWLKAGTGGYETGRFQCLDAECAGENNQSFQDAIGFTLDGFADESNNPTLNDRRTGAGTLSTTAYTVEPYEPNEVLTAFGVTPGAHLIGELPAVRKPALERVDTTMQAKAISRNLEEILTFPEITTMDFRYNEFTGRIDVVPYQNPDATHPLTDNDELLVLTQLHRHPEARFSEIPFDMLKRMIKAHAWIKRYDPVKTWITGLKWDGVPRVKHFYANYLGVDPTNPRAAADSLYLWTALAGRAIEPGVKVDMMPIWRSKQGTRKSSFIESMVPNESMYGELNLNKYDDPETWRRMQGKLILEVNELRGLKTRDAEDIKAFITSRKEEYRPLFHEHQDKRPRRCVFIGTTNETEFLTDPTGNRRFLPIEVGYQELEAVRLDRDQLWAEALYIFEQFGVVWQESQALAEADHDTYRVTHDSYETALWSYLTGPFLQSDARLLPITSSLLLLNALGIEMGYQTKAQQIAIGTAMTALGFRRERISYNGRQIWMYSRPGDDRFPRFIPSIPPINDNGIDKI